MMPFKKAARAGQFSEDLVVSLVDEGRHFAAQAAERLKVADDSARAASQTRNP
jgi:hypothetical protein